MQNCQIQRVAMPYRDSMSKVWLHQDHARMMGHNSTGTYTICMRIDGRSRLSISDNNPCIYPFHTYIFMGSLSAWAPRSHLLELALIVTWEAPKSSSQSHAHAQALSLPLNRLITISHQGSINLISSSTGSHTPSTLFADKPTHINNPHIFKFSCIVLWPEHSAWHP